MKNIAIVMGALFVLGFAINAEAAGNAAAGQNKSAVCAACHGSDGNSMSPTFPKLAGQNASYIVKQLHDFKSGARQNPIMQPQASGLSDQDIEDLAAYFSSQKVAIGQTDPKLADAGKSLYRGGDAAAKVPACIACHGPDGKGMPAAKYPALSGQHDAYVMAQLQAFANGSRANDANHVMRDVASRLTEAQMRAVASYVQGLH